MTNKIRVALIFGGKSAEHEVSINSAKNVYSAFDKTHFDVLPIGVSKSGKWYFVRHPEKLNQLKQVKDNESLEPCALIPGEGAKGQLLLLSDHQQIDFDVAFPLIHGPLGEDGTIQGLFRLYDIPFVGCDVMGSALGMDKEVMKRLLIEANIPSARYELLVASHKKEISFENLKNKLGVPFFIKPANMGSSVGVHKIKNENEFKVKLDDAFNYDSKVLAEEFIQGREIECAVLGNEKPKASVAGEVLPQHEFYSYEAKYLDEKGALLEMPAKLDADTMGRVQQLAINTFQVLCCRGMSRVDFFLKSNGELLVNEINTIPGFTNISMYPKLWGLTGIPYSELISQLVNLALEHHSETHNLRTSFIE